MNPLWWGVVDTAGGGIIICHLLALLAVCWLTYVDILKGSWQIDDTAGMAPYDGKLQKPVSVGNLWKKLRFDICKTPNPNRNWEEAKQPPYFCSPRAHHRLNLWLLCGTVGLLYLWLARLFDPTLAFLTCLLFAVHPFGTQTVAWISGVSYVMGAFLMLLAVHVALLTSDAGWLSTPLGVLGAAACYGLLHWLAIEVMFAMLGIVLLLWWAGLTPFAWVALGFAIYSGLHAFREAIVLRADTFKQQRMENVVKFHWRKGYVVIKSLGYYLCLTFWPKRIGMYHTYTYHYELPYAEAEDKYFWVGLAGLAGLGYGILWGTPPIQFACLWYLAFLGLFLNWITANQFITERYGWLPSLGACLLLASLLPSWAYWLVVGLALMRTWAHLPAYYNETQFYLSNIWNFPQSEVAMGNLGVTYMNRGMVGTSLETWLLGLSIKKDYDVCWYNVGACLRARGPLNLNYVPLLQEHIPPQVIQHAIQEPVKAHLRMARYCLEQAVKSKHSHFRERWELELKELDAILAKSSEELLAMSQPQPAKSVQTTSLLTVTSI